MCVNNDLLPDFLKFRVPNTEVFSEQAVKTFQLRLLKDELTKNNILQLHKKVDESRSEIMNQI